MTNKTPILCQLMLTAAFLCLTLCANAQNAEEARQRNNAANEAAANAQYARNKAIATGRANERAEPVYDQATIDATEELFFPAKARARRAAAAAAATAAAAEEQKRQAERTKQYDAEKNREWERNRPQREADEALQRKYQAERDESKKKYLDDLRVVGAKNALDRAAEFPKDVTPVYLIDAKDGTYYIWDKADKTRYILYKFSNGDVFEGNTKPDAESKFVYADGGIYTGKFSSGYRPNGQGQLTFANKSGIHTGNFENGKPIGQATIQRTNGFHFEGTYLENGNISNAKYYNNKNELITENEYLGIPKSGFAKVYYNSGATYDGNWKNSERNGQGTQNWSKTNYYTGEWKDDQMNGKGVYYLSDGGVYTGNFKNNNFNGQGTMAYLGGGIYTGGWKDDKRSGEGTMKYNDGYTYSGQWKDGERNGKGILTNPNKFYIKGTFDVSLHSDEKYYNNMNERITEEQYEISKPKNLNPVIATPKIIKLK